MVIYQNNYTNVQNEIQMPFFKTTVSEIFLGEKSHLMMAHINLMTYLDLKTLQSLISEMYIDNGSVHAYKDLHGIHA